MSQLNRTIAVNGTTTMTYVAKKLSTEDMELEWAEIQAAQANATMFRPLYNRYYESIFKYIFRRIADEGQTADLCAQTFLKAMQSLHTYTFRGVPFSAWLYRIASNEIQLYVRDQRRKRVVCVEDQHFAQIADEIDDLKYNEQHQEVMMNCLQELKPDEISLIEMRFFEGRAFKEIADILEMTEANAKVKTYRVLEKIKRRLLENNIFKSD